MKKIINILTIIILAFYIILCFTVLPSAIKSERSLIKRVDDIEGRITFIESQIQTMQKSYVSYDDLQPVLDSFKEYQGEVDEIRNNLNDFNGLWEQMFEYKQKKYVMRGGS